MKEKITERFKELIDIGTPLVEKVKKTHPQDQLKMLNKEEATYIEWMNSVSNLLSVVCNNNSSYVLNSKKILEIITSKTSLDNNHVNQMYGLLCSASNEWSNGLMGQIEYIYVAETFDDFLDHAEEFHKAKKIIESSILASTVLEDTMKKIAIKNSLNLKLTLDPLIDELVKIGVFTKVKAKRVKAYAGVRNSALHANWSDIDINDVGEMIKGTRELIEEFLS